MINKSQEFEERLTAFSINIIQLCKNLPLDTISKPIISQLIRSASGIGANYCEANNASSKKDFANKIYICKKESQETKYWLRLLRANMVNSQDNIDQFSQECHEFVLIFQKIISTMKNK